MPPVIDVFGIAVLVLGLTALGLSVLFEASRLSTAAGKQALVRRRMQARERERLDLKIRLDGAQSEATAKQQTLDNLLAERSRLQSATSSLKLSKVEMVHEVGEPEPGAHLYQADLRTDTSPVRGEPRRIVFANAIWERNNIAHVWAESPEAAMAAVQRAFHARTGITVTRMQRAALARPDQKTEAPGAPADAGTGMEPTTGDRTERPALRMANTPRAA